MSNIKYELSIDKKVMYGYLPQNIIFIIDADMYEKIKDISFYPSFKDMDQEQNYLVDCHGTKLHDYLLPHVDGLEIDHINMNRFDNRVSNLRYVTHQQNQINQGIQKNNTSGYSGVSYYEPRGKYRARIKVMNRDIHLGYYKTLNQAVQARNHAMKCLFGPFGRYDDVEEAPEYIKKIVENKCKPFYEDAAWTAFFDFI